MGKQAPYVGTIAHPIPANSDLKDTFNRKVLLTVAVRQETRHAVHRLGKWPSHRIVGSIVLQCILTAYRTAGRLLAAPTLNSYGEPCRQALCPAAPSPQGRPLGQLICARAAAPTLN